MDTGIADQAVHAYVLEYIKRFQPQGKAIGAVAFTVQADALADERLGRPRPVAETFCKIEVFGKN